VVTQNLPVLANQENGDGNLSDRQNIVAFNATTGAAPAAPVVTVPSNGLLPNPGYEVSGKARPDPLRLPLIDAWNFSVQRSITPTLSVTAAYVGNKGTHTLADGDGNNTNPNEAGIFLPQQYSVVPGMSLHYDPNPVQGIGLPPGIAANGGTAYTNYLQRYYGGALAACSATGYFTGLQAYAAANPTQYPNGVAAGQCGWTQSVAYYHDALDTHFNALQVTVAKQLQHGVSLTANYQWARAFDYNSGYATWQKSLAYGRDSNVREQQLVAYGVWQLPFGRGTMVAGNTNHVVDYIIGHWEISGTTNWAGGLPFTLSMNECGQSVPSSAPCYANSASGARLPLHLHEVNPHTYTYFNTIGPLGTRNNPTPNNGYSLSPLDEVGNVGRNTYFGPNFVNTDMAIQKNFPIHEGTFAQFRMDAFNTFNHFNPGNPGGNIENGNTISGEQPNSATNPSARYLQFSLRVQF
jgi:hypothetical protein